MYRSIVKLGHHVGDVKGGLPMSQRAMRELPLAVLQAIAAGAIATRHENGERKNNRPSPYQGDWASI